MLVALLLCTAWVGQAQNLTVAANDGVGIYGISSLQQFIEYYLMYTGNTPITSLEISAGTFTTEDWNYLYNNKSTLSSLESFTITRGISSVADMPDLSSYDSYFSSSLTSVSIDASFAVGSRAFYNRYNLTTVSLPKATSIGDYAFENCSSLTTVSLPKATSIGSCAFRECKALSTVSLPKATSIGRYAFRECKALSTVSLPKATSIDSYAFYDCHSLTTVSLPVANTINSYAFAYCYSLTFLKLGATPPTVSESHFDYCPSLRYLTLVDSYGNALQNEALANAINAYRNANDGNMSDNLWYGWRINEQPDSLKIKVNNGPEFTGISLQEIVETSGIVTDNVTQLEVVSGDFLAPDVLYMRRSFTSLEKLTLSSAKEIGVELNHNSLKEVNAPLLEIVGDNVFSECTALTMVSLPKAVSIGQHAFYYCKALTTVTLPEATSIGNDAFRDCDALTSVSLPLAQSIGYQAFSSCLSLTFLELGATVPSVQNSTFDYCPSLRFLKVPDGALNDYNNFDDGQTGDNLWYGWRINENPNPLTIKVNDGTAIANKASLEEAIADSHVSPDNVTQLEVLSGDLLASDAAYIRSSLTALKKLILTTAKECNLLLSEHPSLQEVYAPLLEIVGQDAFFSCTALSVVYLPAATNIGFRAFEYCSALTTVSLPAATSIGVYAFSTLTSLELGATPPMVGNWAFDKCPSPRYLKLVDSDGNPLTGAERQAALAAYKADGGWNNSTSTWYGWSLMLSIAATANTDEGGTVSGAGSIACGSTVTLEATPSEGYRFVKWSNGETANP